MKKFIVAASMIGALLVALVLRADDAASDATQAAQKEAQVKLGEHLVKSIGCGDCHTPHKMGPNGPEEDMTRFLSGHPADAGSPPAPTLSDPWMGAFTGDSTAFAGPWGVSFTRNLTPDNDTGLGKWTEQNFIETIRSGRELGKGRELLPPMPWPAFGNLSDDELKAIYAYLRTIPAIHNAVPEPLPPPAPPAK